jgi:hypothetical protein
MRGLLGHQAVDFLGTAMAKAVAHEVLHQRNWHLMG